MKFREWLSQNIINAQINKYEQIQEGENTKEFIVGMGNALNSLKYTIKTYPNSILGDKYERILEDILSKLDKIDKEMTIKINKELR